MAQTAPHLPTANMKLHEDVNVNKALLPRLLPRFLIKLHLSKFSIGFIITIMGILAMSLYSMFGFITLLAAGLISVCAGIFGCLAIKLKFLMLHGGSVFVYGLSFFMSLIAYMAIYAGVGSLYTDTRSGVVFVICLLLLVMDLIASALSFGVELIVIYVADCQRRLAIEDMRREASLP
ncbi:hypothetical protein E2C01_056317 [Portunus trituberculatus]|uniref:MARVEL domain-containing protein n=1 Tax=Portunus trituberculatus TaxID=210409 RepID=A0A5B7H077_PORTR|nr:hypothetical protein [Portunus trituberculatus]